MAGGQVPLVVDLTHFFHERSGGVRTYLAAKSRHLAAHGWRHALVVPGVADGCRRWERSALVTVASPAIPGTGGYRLLVRHRTVVARLMRMRPALIELGSPYLIPSMAAMAAGRLGVPVVGFYHANVSEAHLAPLLRRLGLPSEGSWRALAERPLWAYLRRVLRGLDGVVAPSRAAAEQLARHGALPPGGCRVVPFGVDLQRFHPARRSAAWRQAHLPPTGGPAGRAQEPTILLYAGRLAPDKGMESLTRAWHHIHHHLAGRVVLWLAGDGPQRAQVLRDAGPSVRWLGFLGGDELAIAFASADLYLSASPSETFGLALAEAQASGLPVVAPAWGSIPEVVDPESGVVVALRCGEPPQEMARALAAAVVALVAGADDLPRRQAQARRFAERQFSWARTFARLLAFYEWLLERRRGEAPA